MEKRIWKLWMAIFATRIPINIMRSKSNFAKWVLSYRKFLYDNFSVQVLRKGAFPMVSPFLRMTALLGGKVTKGLVKEIKVSFNKLSQLGRDNGIPGLVLYLKGVWIKLQHYLLGHVGPSVLQHRISVTKSGIPKIFPPAIRKLLRERNLFIMRVCSSFASIYRDLKFKGPLKLMTITAPFSGDVKSLERITGYVPRFTRLMLKKYNKGNHLPVRSGVWRPLLLSKSSPQNFKGFISSSPGTMTRSALALSEQQLKDIQTLYKFVYPNSKSVLYRLGLVDLLEWVRTLAAPLSKFYKLKVGGITGRLSLKFEAAGKVRVFAMVDPWTQNVMFPIHKSIFRLLGRIPMDGTFDQLRPLNRAWRFKQLYSMDLSSATDRLPLSIQVELLQQAFGMPCEVSLAWKRLLVDREYYLDAVEDYNIKGLFRYAVGQPMGALSSWAMLALTHHFIIQVAAWESGFPINRLFTAYAVLGDDVCIFSTKVAKSYIRLLDQLGVECNLSKSILSPSGVGLEFAKKTFFGGVDVSPAPFKEFYSSLNSPASFAQMCIKYNLSLSQAAKALGYGWKVISSVNTLSIDKMNRGMKALAMTLLMLKPDTYSESIRFPKRFDLEVLCQAIVFYLQTVISDLYEKLLVWEAVLKKINFDLITDKAKKFAWWVPTRLVWVQLSNTMINHRLKPQYKDTKTMVDMLAGALMLTLTFAAGSSQVFLKKLFNFLYDFSKVESLLNHLSPSLLLVGEKRDEDVRPSAVRAERLNNNLNKVVILLSKAPEFKDDTPETIVKPKNLPKSESEFSVFPVPVPSVTGTIILSMIPIIIKKKMILRIARFFTRSAIIKVILRRLSWIAAFTSLIGVLLIIKGPILVFSGLYAIFVAIGGLMTSPGIQEKSWISIGIQVVFNIICHTLELYIAASIIASWWYFPLVSGMISLDLQAYADGSISLWYMLSDVFWFNHQLIIQIASDSVSLGTQVGDSVLSSNSILTNFGIGSLFTALMLWLVKWFVGF